MLKKVSKNYAKNKQNPLALWILKVTDIPLHFGTTAQTVNFAQL